MKASCFFSGKKVKELTVAEMEKAGGVTINEKLVECHGLRVSRETLRKWMTEDGL